ncbi:heterokaryon incompatibility protein [Colletotrichum asianum]
MAMMGELYSSASMMLSWLSSVDGYVPFTFETFDSIFREVEIENSGECEAKYTIFARLRMDDWVRNFNNLAELRYWRRVWIFQEVVLLKNLVYLYPLDAIRRTKLEGSVRYIRDIANTRLKRKGFEVAVAMLAVYTPDFSILLFKVFATISTGLIQVGLGTGELDLGGLIRVLEGCQSPMVLKRARKASNDFIHGIAGP